MAKKDGGSAFPYKARGENVSDNHIEYVFSGISKRDYFAGQALPALLGLSSFMKDFTPDAISEAAYKLADAMIAERSKE